MKLEVLHLQWKLKLHAVGGHCTKHATIWGSTYPSLLSVSHFILVCAHIHAHTQAHTQNTGRVLADPCRLPTRLGSLPPQQKHRPAALHLPWHFRVLAAQLSPGLLSELLESRDESGPSLGSGLEGCPTQSGHSIYKWVFSSLHITTCIWIHN